MADFLAFPKNSLKELDRVDLSGFNFSNYTYTTPIGIRNFLSLCSQLTYCENVQTVDLSGSSIFQLSTDKVEIIFDTLYNSCKKLRELQVNNDTLMPESFQRLIKIIEKGNLSNIVCLGLNSALYCLKIEDIKVLFNVIKLHMPNIKFLGLSYTLPGEAFAPATFHQFDEIFRDFALSKATPIEIDLTRHEFSPEQAAELRAIEQETIARQESALLVSYQMQNQSLGITMAPETSRSHACRFKLNF